MRKFSDGLLIDAENNLSVFRYKYGALSLPVVEEHGNDNNDIQSKVGWRRMLSIFYGRFWILLAIVSLIIISSISLALLYGHQSYHGKKK